MSVITYTVVGSNDDDRNGLSQSITLHAATFSIGIEPGNNSILKSSMDRSTFQRTTITLPEVVKFSQQGITKINLQLWREFYISQMRSNNPFTLDASDKEPFNRVLQCMLKTQPFDPSFTAVDRYKTALTAEVIT